MADYYYGRYEKAWEDGWNWLRSLQLSARTYNAIVNNKISTMSELRSMNFEDLMSLSGLGVTGAQEILDKLTEIGVDKLNELENQAPESRSPSSGKLGETFSEVGEISIYQLPLSPRTANALYNNGIEAVSDLAKYTLGDLVQLQGFGRKGLEEMEQLLDRPDLQDFLTIKVPEKLSLDEYLSSKINRSHLAIYDSYFGLTENRGDNVTLQSVSDQFGVTRERIRQIVKKVSEKVAKAINEGVVDTKVYDLLIANVNKPMHTLPELSTLYRKEAIVRLFTESPESALAIYRSPGLRSEWLVTAGDDTFHLAVQRTIKGLKAQIAPVDIRELASTLNIDESILYDLNNVTIDNSGLIVLNSNKIALGVDYRQNILDYMDKKISPVTIRELSEALNLTENQVKGRLYHMEEIVNVGKSTYGLVKYGYTGESIVNIAERLLKESGQPLHIDKITRLVTKYKIIENSSVPAMISMYPGTFTYIGEGYYALAEWGYASASQQRTKYEVPVTDAVTAVIKDAGQPLSPKDIIERITVKYGDKTTNKPVTVYAACARLLEQGILMKLGTEHSPFYNLRDN